MKIIFLGGNHPRHLYIAKKIEENFGLDAFFLEVREEMVPQSPLEITEHDKKNYNLHFKKREIAENRFFKEPKLPDCEIFESTKEELSSVKSAEYVQTHNADIAIIFGTSLIKEPLYSALPQHTINIHLGLSPKYRGAATLFWPFYFLEPTFAGSTFHYIVSEPDAGAIIHQCTPILEKNDGIHDVACKTVVQSGDDLLRLLDLFKRGKKWNPVTQKSTGKNFLTTDFRPEHLRVIYDLYNDDIVRKYLKGDFCCPVPELIRQFT